MTQSSVLHIISLPADVGGQRGFAMILEVDDGTDVDEKMVTGWRDFARDAGARALMITTRDLVVLHQPAEDVPPPGPCPSYTEGMNTVHNCTLRARHDGLHEEIRPGTGGFPPQITTWGDRQRFEQSAGFYSVACAAPPLDLQAEFTGGGYAALAPSLEEQLAEAQLVPPNCGVTGCTRSPFAWAACPMRGCNVSDRALASRGEYVKRDLSMCRATAACELPAVGGPFCAGHNVTEPRPKLPLIEDSTS